MTREEIIKKGEKLLEYTYGQAISRYSTSVEVKDYAKRGISQLDMLWYILNEDWEDYGKWFDKFRALY